MFSEAIGFRNDGYLNESKVILLEIVEQYNNHPKIVTVYTVLGGVLRDQKEYRQSIKYFKKASELEPSLELASLGTYLSYIDMGQFDNAISEMDRFLSSYPADNYKVTLEELIGDLRNGYARDHESTIMRLSKKHRVSIFGQLDQ